MASTTCQWTNDFTILQLIMLQAGGGHVDLSSFSKSFLSKGSLHDTLKWAWISLTDLVPQTMRCGIASLCHKIATEDFGDLLL